MKKLVILCLCVMAFLAVCGASAEGREAYGDMLRAELYLFEEENASIRVPIVTNFPVKQASYDMWYNQDGQPADAEVKEEIFIDGEHVETGDGWYAYDLYLHFTTGKQTESISRIAVKIDGELYDLYPAGLNLNVIEAPDEFALLKMDQILTIPDRKEMPFQCSLYVDQPCVIKAIRFGAGQTVKEMRINDVLYADPEQIELAVSKDEQLAVEVWLNEPENRTDYGSTYFQMETVYQDKDGNEAKLYSHSVNLTSFDHEARLNELKAYLRNRKGN